MGDPECIPEDIREPIAEHIPGPIPLGREGLPLRGGGRGPRTCDLLVFVVTRALSGVDLTRRFRIGLVRPDNRRLSRERQAA